MPRLGQTAPSDLPNPGPQLAVRVGRTPRFGRRCGTAWPTGTRADPCGRACPSSGRSGPGALPCAGGSPRFKGKRPWQVVVVCSAAADSQIVIPSWSVDSGFQLGEIEPRNGFGTFNLHKHIPEPQTNLPTSVCTLTLWERFVQTPNRLPSSRLENYFGDAEAVRRATSFRDSEP